MSSIYFDPEGSGLSVFMGPSEARLMELAWSEGSLTVKRALFLWDGEKRPAYTTVMTILTRLFNKGLLGRERQGRVFVYSPATKRKAYVKQRLDLVASCLKHNFKKSL